MDKTLVIYSGKITNRLIYALDMVLTRINGISYQLTENFDEFLSADGPKINYSDFPSDSSLHIVPSGLLYESSIKKVDPKYAKLQGLHCLFTTNVSKEIPFDIFSAAFYMLTRYEEYLPFTPDEHGRFSAEQSVAWKHGFLEEPVVQQWAIFLGRILQDRFRNLIIKKQDFRIEATIDVDVAYAFSHRNFGRMFMASGRDLVTFQWNRLLDRALVGSGSKPDPFDTYSYIEMIHQKFGFPVNLFYLIGDYSHFDRNLPYDSPKVQNLIKSLNNRFSLGVHPSYQAADDFETLKKEVTRLAEITGTTVTKSRQHFLRLSFPKTYHWLLNLGITDDYSMCYHDKPGFRAGISNSFPFYDLIKDSSTSLIIHPFAFMERTLKDRLYLDPDMALFKIQELMKHVRQVNGTFGTLWHNDSLSNYGEWKRWRYVYEVMLSMAYTSSLKKKKVKQFA